MPQMSGRLCATLIRNHNQIFSGLKYMAADYLWKIKDDDIDYIEKYDTRPDGTSIKSVPTRFIHPLEDPSKITTDLIGSMIEYYNMADNFKNKTKIANDLEVVLSKVKQTSYTKNGKHKNVTNAAARLEKYMDMFVYGKRTDDMEVSIGSHKINLSKFLSKVISYTGTVNLAENVWPMA